MSRVEPPEAHRLAIVIPAYRAEFLGAALDSLRAQTHGGFHVYVGDDASPQALLEPICAQRQAAGLPLTFRRFDANLGGQDLVAQWQRCVGLSRDEEWVWLFSDDDLADPRCVERFYHALEAGELAGNVCRFNTATVDHQGAVLAIHPPHPPTESAVNFAYHRLTLQRRSYAPEHLFRRSAYTANGGFVRFPFALGSDDASWITFTGDRPIVTLPDALVYWRWSGENTSALQGTDVAGKILALATFSRWMEQRFADVTPSAGGLALPSRIDMGQLARIWFIMLARNLPASFGYLQAVKLAGELQRQGFGGAGVWVFRLWRATFLARMRRAGDVIKRLLHRG